MRKLLFGFFTLSVIFLSGCSEQVDTSARYVFSIHTVASYLEAHDSVYSEYLDMLRKVTVIAVQDMTKIENAPIPGIVHKDSSVQCVESDLPDGGRNRHITEVFTPLEGVISNLLQVVPQGYVPETVTVFECGILYFYNRVRQYKGRHFHPIESLPVNDGDGVRLAFVFHV